MSTGLYYVADETRVPAAVCSAASARRHAPDLSLAIATNATEVPEVFDHHLNLSMEDWDWKLRIQALRKTPFDRTLYLDNDTFVVSDVSGIFRILDRFDLAAAQAPIRHTEMVLDAPRPESAVPHGFVEYNCGVLLFKQSDAINEFLTAWEDRFNDYRRKSEEVHDQPAFRDAVYDGSIEIATLPPEYNFRLPFDGFASDEVKIIHGQAANYEHIARRLNAHMGPRSISCVSVGQSWEPLIGPGRVRTYWTKARVLVRELIRRSVRAGSETSHSVKR